MLPTFGPKELMLVLPVVPILSVGNPTGACGLDPISFQRQLAALARASLSNVDEKV